MKEALLAYEADSIEGMRTVQGESTHPTFKNAPQEVLDEVYKKLAECTYKHYVD